MKNLTKMFLAACLLTVFAFSLHAQGLGIKADGTAPDNSAILDVSSTSKGFLPPRMTTAQRNLISSPVAGLVIYNTDDKALNVFNGTSWSLMDPVVCGNSFTDPRDNKVYTTVQIGDQCWMAKNLAYLPSVVGPGTGDGTSPYYYVYGYDGTDVTTAKATTNYQTYGVLYNWPSSLTACPTGWHLPTDTEWTTLTTYLGGTSVAGGKMKETGTTHWTSPNTDATNSSGFTGLPGGSRGTGGTFDNLGSYGDFWSSSEDSPTNAWNRNLNYYSANVFRTSYSKSYGFSVRCLRD